MLIDPCLQQEIIKRAVEGHFGNNPDQAVHSLGTLKVPDGREVSVYLRHAADAILLDQSGNIVLITRRNNPGAGLKALPGGFIETVQGIGGASAPEKAVTAASREAVEETGIDKRLLEGAHVIPVGNRSYDRPFDIRVASSDLQRTKIKKGDFFAVSTQAFSFQTARDLSQVALEAGDDARRVLVARISSLTPDQFGIADHLPMIFAAQAAALA